MGGKSFQKKKHNRETTMVGLPYDIMSHENLLLSIVLVV